MSEQQKEPADAGVAESASPSPAPEQRADEAAGERPARAGKSSGGSRRSSRGRSSAAKEKAAAADQDGPDGTARSADDAGGADGAAEGRRPRRRRGKSASAAETAQDAPRTEGDGAGNVQKAQEAANGPDSPDAGDAGDAPKSSRSRRGRRRSNKAGEAGSGDAPAASDGAEAADAPAAAADSSDGEDAAAGADAAESSEDAPRRRGRRGRRGGRGRGRKRGAREAEGDSSADQDSAEDLVESLDPAAPPLPGGSAFPADSLDEMDEPEEDGDAADDGAASGSRKGGVRTAAARARAATGRRRMYIGVVPGEQVEVALSEDGVVLEYYLDMLHQCKLKGNIYKGVIHNIDANLQAAFVSYGAGKNGFLQIDEVHPEYYLSPHEPARGRKFPPIQKVLRTGQEVLVQVVKDPIGTKGAFLSTWISLAGRFLVLTPGQEQIGVSRKVESEEERSRLREMMNGLEPGQGFGVIVRTVSAGTTKTTLKNDLQYLKRVYRDIRRKATEESAPALIYQEPGLIQRAVRDYLTESVAEIWVDNAEVADTIRETVALLFPRKKDLVRLHSDTRQALWDRFNLRKQLDQINAREVHLPSGGRLVFDQTEALMAIDVNSGKISGKNNFEAMAHRTNMEAAETIARQLRLRDVGGQVVVDFIEMRDRKHVAEVEKTLRTAMKSDRARHDVGRMSAFSLLELVRQRTGTSALGVTMEPCPHCGGTGQRRNMEWQALQSLREIRRMLATSHQPGPIRYEAVPELALHLLNHKRDTLREMEQTYGKDIEIVFRP